MAKNCNNYIRFREVKAYIYECFLNTVKTSSDIKKICEKSGYKKEDKFLKHLNRWINLEIDVPILFLNSIGAKTEVIFEKLDSDKTEFEEYKNVPLFGAYGVIRIMAAIYNKINIPQNYLDMECVDYVAGRLTHDFNYVIHFGAVKSIWIYSLSNEEITFYNPDLKLGNAALLIKGKIPPVHYIDNRMFDLAGNLKLNKLNI